MEKEQEHNQNELNDSSKQDLNSEELKDNNKDQGIKKESEQEELSPEEKILTLEDKLARTLAEMENQRRRFEKEKEDAFDYGGYAFAKEALNLIDNLERSKQALNNDDKLKNSEALKKNIRALRYNL